MATSIFLLLSGFIKLFSGFDLITFAFLYFLVRKKFFYYDDLLLYIFWAELFNTAILGTYIISFSIFYLLHKKYRNFFKPNLIFDFLFLFWGYFFIRSIYNLPFILGYNVNLRIYFSQVMRNFAFIIALFWSQYWVEKCLAKFIKLS